LKTAAYLELKNNAKDLIETYQSIFSAEIILEYQYNENMTNEKSLVGKIFHAEMKIGDLNLYVSDSGVEPSFQSIKFVAEISDPSEARRCFESLSVEGKIISDFKKLSIGPTIGTVEDKFGIRWDIVIC
jgi:PhnB protein